MYLTKSQLVATFLLICSVSSEAFNPFQDSELVDTNSPQKTAEPQQTNFLPVQETVSRQQPTLYSNSQPISAATGYAPFPEVASGPLPIGFVPPQYQQRPLVNQDQHFLTRPVSIVNTAHGPHYVPHLINTGPAQFQEIHDDLNVQQVPDFHNHFMPVFGKPGITVFANNVYIGNDKPEYAGEIGGFGTKPLTPLGMLLLAQKLPFLSRLLTSQIPKTVTLENKMEIKEENNGIGPFHPQPFNQDGTFENGLEIVNQPYQPRPFGMFETPVSGGPFSACPGSNSCGEVDYNNSPTGVGEVSAQQVMPSLSQVFHPLLAAVPDGFGSVPIKSGNAGSVNSLGNGNTQKENNTPKAPTNKFGNVDNKEGNATSGNEHKVEMLVTGLGNMAVDVKKPAGNKLD